MFLKKKLLIYVMQSLGRQCTPFWVLRSFCNLPRHKQREQSRRRLLCRIFQSRNRDRLNSQMTSRICNPVPPFRLNTKLMIKLLSSERNSSMINLFTAVARTIFQRATSSVNINFDILLKLSDIIESFAAAIGDNPGDKFGFIGDYCIYIWRWFFTRTKLSIRMNNIRIPSENSSIIIGCQLKMIF